ncbi:LacI family DNA-binding transcriptional regulator [Shimia sp. MMG029]|uniref:LacI family DNA-binding transcriptional regulator n=1 Tax=Shimia sp. MMG029 TaxID=3021978 RepID=UPI0022FED968|nr:substrate-binding domain-containing protein [Shimia sp. MMG029]MDA5556931.1 substrate-binding domain-containing protein [Shimia sp. MMG029]
MNLKELSEKLGLSQTTVSRALNGYPEVRESTRQKVLEAARAHNYAPNTRAKTLATGRAMTIGHVLPVSKKHEMVNPIFADFIAGAGEIYSDNGYDLLLSVVNDEDEEASYRKLVSRGAVDGLIVHGPKVDDRRIALLQELSVPFVVHGRSTEVRERYSWVDVNNKRAFQRATEFLLDLGHRRIALLNGLADMDFATRRGAGYVAALEGRDVPLRPDLVFHDEMTENYGYETCRKALAMEKPPTAFVVSSIIPAIGLRRALSEAGLTMGRDVSVVIHDDALSYFSNDGDIPAFTSVRSSVREAGRKVAHALIDMITNPGTDLPQVMLEATLTVGQSTGPAPALRQALKQEV